MIVREEIIPVGKFNKPHALKGELNMLLDIDPKYFEEGNPLIVDYEGIFVPYYLDSIRTKGKTSYLIKLSGVDSEEEATAFVNKDIYILKKDAEEWLDSDEIDSEDLIGFKVYDTISRKNIGEIIEIDDSTQNIVLILKSEAGEEIYVPANDDLIDDIDEENKLITMTLPEGLLDINSVKEP